MKKNESNKRKKILIITTGGTIAMSSSAKEGAKPALDGKALVDLVPEINNFADIEILEFCNIPSPSMTPDMMFDLSKLVTKKDPDYDGFVITHGTDTVEETSYFLFITLKTKKPVVFTAAMRLNKEIGLDGPRNLMNAVIVASSSNSYDRGVVLAINDAIYSVREVYKSSTNQINAFASPKYGTLGMIDVDRVVYFRKAEIRYKYDIEKIETRVDLIKLYAGIDRKFIDASINSGVKAIIIEAFGRGNVTISIRDGIFDAIKKGIPVIITSRVPNGMVKAIYGYDGGAKQLEDAGAIMGNDLNGEKARLKVMALLGAGYDIAGIRQHFSLDMDLFE